MRNGRGRGPLSELSRRYPIRRPKAEALMYAIVEIAGKQFKVQADQKLYIPRQKAQVDDTITFDRVLLVADGDEVQVGAPTVADASVTAKVLDHVKGDKVMVFKKKRRKRYRVTRGHRQQYTQVQIDALSLNGKGKSKKKKQAEPAEAEEA